VPGEIVRRMHAGVVKARAGLAVRKYRAEADYLPVGSLPEEITAFLGNDIARRAGIAKRIGIQPQ